MRRSPRAVWCSSDIVSADAVDVAQRSVPTSPLSVSLTPPGRPEKSSSSSPPCTEPFVQALTSCVSPLSSESRIPQRPEILATTTALVRQRTAQGKRRPVRITSLDAVHEATPHRDLRAMPRRNCRAEFKSNRAPLDSRPESVKRSSPTDRTPFPDTRLPARRCSARTRGQRRSCTRRVSAMQYVLSRPGQGTSYSLGRVHAYTHSYCIRSSDFTLLQPLSS